MSKVSHRDHTDWGVERSNDRTELTCKKINGI